MGGLVRSMTSWPHSSQNAALLWNRTQYTPRIALLYTFLRAADRPCDGRHQKRECDANFFVCLLVSRYRIDALTLTIASRHIAVRRRFLPCATNTLVNTRQGRRIAQAALNLCRWLEQHHDLGTCLTFISLNAKLVACRTSTPWKMKQGAIARALPGEQIA